MVACQYRKNDCKIVQDPQNISYHEEECEFRDVECVLGNCPEIVAYSNLTKHLDEVHEKNVFTPSGIRNAEKTGEILIKCDVLEKNFSPRSNGRPWRLLVGPILFNEKHFLLQSEINPAKDFVLAWMQMYGSRFEAKNYRYSIQLQEKEDLGTPIYKGPMKSLDDRKTDVFTSKVGLVVPLDVLKKHLGNETKIAFEIKIEDLKPKDDEMDSEASNQDN